MSDSQMDVALYLKNQDDPQLKSIGDFVEGRTKRILSLNKELQSLKDQLAQLKQDLEKAEKVIEFYAKEPNWVSRIIGVADMIHEDDLEQLELAFGHSDWNIGGKKARAYFQEKQDQLKESE